MATKQIQIAVVKFFKRFLDQIVPTNKVIEAFNARADVNLKFRLAPGRLVDQHEEMLKKYRIEGVNGARSPLPIFLMGFDRGYSPSGLEKGRSIAQRNFTVVDNLNNWFKVRVSKHDQRVQIVLYAAEHDTAFSLADQFSLFCREYTNRHLFAYYEYNGRHYPFAVTLEDNQVFGAQQQIPEQINLIPLVFDLNFICHTPYFVGDEIDKTPYLPAVKTIVLSHTDYKRDELAWEKVIKGSRNEDNFNGM